MNYCPSEHLVFYVVLLCPSLFPCTGHHPHVCKQSVYLMSLHLINPRERKCILVLVHPVHSWYGSNNYIVSYSRSQSHTQLFVVLQLQATKSWAWDWKRGYTQTGRGSGDIQQDPRSSLRCLRLCVGLNFRLPMKLQHSLTDSCATYSYNYQWHCALPCMSHFPSNWGIHTTCHSCMSPQAQQQGEL